MDGVKVGPLFEHCWEKNALHVTEIVLKNCKDDFDGDVLFPCFYVTYWPTLSCFTLVVTTSESSDRNHWGLHDYTESSKLDLRKTFRPSPAVNISQWPWQRSDECWFEYYNSFKKTGILYGVVQKTAAQSFVYDNFLTIRRKISLLAPKRLAEITYHNEHKIFNIWFNSVC